MRPRGALEYRRVFDELLRITRIVGRAVVLALRVWCVVEWEGRWVSLLGTLTDRLCLIPGLRRLRQLLRRLSIGRWQARSSVRLLRRSRKTLNLIMPESIPVTKSTRTGVGIVEVLFCG